ncbi:MAG: bifunctional riboflavin kinase/FAD synthetase [Chitinophagaceae bacterium]|nr:bifunctional riboflavin kinase/FAD synthetase [Chitinophagaceae bacterium]
MNVFYGLDHLPVFKNAVVTIGTFDGVHSGHQVILNSLRRQAAAVGGETVIITFEPHPRFVLSQGAPSFALLNTLDEKIENLRHRGIDHLVVVNFTLAFAGMDAADYVEKFLVEKFHPHTIIIGYDHMFGNGRKGNFQLLETMKVKYGYQLQEIPMQLIEQNKISSTQIRQALLNGDVARAARFLGQPYSLQGVVIHGKKRGRLIGYPTANLHTGDVHKLIPANGVYAVQVFVKGQLYNGMLNIGNNPTFEAHLPKSIEVNIFDFDADIYGETIKIMLVDRLRDEQKFEGVEILVQAIAQDKLRALQMLT